MGNDEWCYYQLTDGVLKSVDPKDKAYEPGWGYVYKFHDWWDQHAMSQLCQTMLGDSAWRGKNNDDLSNKNARWVYSFGRRIYFRSMEDVKLCCMQQILSEIAI